MTILVGLSHLFYLVNFGRFWSICDDFGRFVTILVDFSRLVKVMVGLSQSNPLRFLFDFSNKMSSGLLSLSNRNEVRLKNGQTNS